jgi:hypothetical protein
MNLIEEVLRKYGPCLTSDLARHLVEDYRITPDAARKQVSRGFKGMNKLAYLTFPRNSRFAYLIKDYGSPQYWESLIEIILTSNSAYSLALGSIIQREGIVPLEHFKISCGAPLRQQKHLSPDTILNRLVEAGVLEIIEIPSIGTCITLSAITNLHEPDALKLNARIITEDILLKAVVSWLRNLGMASFHTITIRNQSTKDVIPQVGTFLWDLTGPSYLSPLVTWGDNSTIKPGFIVCDVFLGSTITKTGIAPFIQKCKTLNNLKNIGKCLYIFIANGYEKEALIEAKKNGIIPATPESIFGDYVAKGLNQLTSTLIDAAKGSIDIKEFNELFCRLDSIEGAATNLRGALFELICAELARKTISSEVTLSEIYTKKDGEKSEVDVTAILSKREVHFIECKGYKPSGTISDDDVDKWINKTIPTVRSSIIENSKWSGYDLHFEFWTTGNFTNESKIKLENAKKTKKYTVSYKESEDILILAKSTKDKSLINVIKQHFFNHPMTTARNDSQRRLNRSNKIKENKNTILKSITRQDLIEDEDYEIPF